MMQEGELEEHLLHGGVRSRGLEQEAGDHGREMSVKGLHTFARKAGHQRALVCQLSSSSLAMCMSVLLYSLVMVHCSREGPQSGKAVVCMCSAPGTTFLCNQFSMTDNLRRGWDARFQRSSYGRISYALCGIATACFVSTSNSTVMSQYVCCGVRPLTPKLRHVGVA